MNMSTTSPGTLVDGIPMLQQSVSQYFRTVKGSIPLHPELGFGIYEYVDRNASTLMNIVREIQTGMALWDSRVNVLTITPIFGVGTLTVNVTWSPADQASNIITQSVPLSLPS